MIKPDDPRILAEALRERSTCEFKVAAVVADSHGIYSWGWNSSGRDGFGEHAETAAIRRANKKRLAGSTIYVAARRGHQIYSRPCGDCIELLRAYGVYKVYYTLSGKDWVFESI